MPADQTQWVRTHNENTHTWITINSSHHLTWLTQSKKTAISIAPWSQVTGRLASWQPQLDTTWQPAARCVSKNGKEKNRNRHDGCHKNKHYVIWHMTMSNWHNFLISADCLHVDSHGLLLLSCVAIMSTLKNSSRLSSSQWLDKLSEWSQLCWVPISWRILTVYGCSFIIWHGPKENTDP